MPLSAGTICIYHKNWKRLSDNNQKDKLLSAISTHSPMSWAHINLLGEYDFSDEKLQDSVGIRPPKIMF